MRVRTTLIPIVGSLALMLGAASGAQAAKHHPKQAVKHPKSIAYVFTGKAVAAPGANATSLQVTVTSGNSDALHAIIGASQPLTFTLAATTHVTVWQAGAPTVGSSASVQAGDRVNVTVSAPAHTPLAQLLAVPARSIGDTTALQRPAGLLYLFYGKATGPADATAHTTSLSVSAGNWNALEAMLGQPIAQAFTYSPSTTQFLHWTNGRSTRIAPTSIVAGDPLTIRVIAPAATPFATLATMPAWRVNDHEPIATVTKDIGATSPLAQQ